MLVKRKRRVFRSRWKLSTERVGSPR